MSAGTIEHVGNALKVKAESNGFLKYRSALIFSSQAVLIVLTYYASFLLRLDTDLTVKYLDGTVEVTAESQVGSGEKAYWGLSHGLLIDDFYRQVRAGQPFWIDAVEAMKTLRIVTAVYDQSPALSPIALRV